MLVPRGNYRISRPLSIRRPGVVLRGEDANASVIMAAPIHGDCSVPNQGPPNCAPYQGAAMLEIEGTVGGNRLATVVVAASRGERRLRLSSVAGIRAGQWIRLTMRNPADNSLGCHLYLERGCLNPERRQWYSGRIVDWLVRVESVAGDTVTLERALRLDVRMGWSPEIRSFSASVEDSGIENLSLRFSGEAYAGHNNEQGHYGILIRDAYNCWVRDVTIIDADRGVDIRGGYNTISGLQLRAALRTPQLTAKVFATGHYGVSVAGPRSQDNLIENSVVQTVFVHNLSVASFANGNVFSGIRSAVPHFDHHGAGAYENLYTEISLADSGQDLFLSGGRRPDEPGERAPRCGTWCFRAAPALAGCRRICRGSRWSVSMAWRLIAPIRRCRTGGSSPGRVPKRCRPISTGHSARCVSSAMARGAADADRDSQPCCRIHPTPTRLGEEHRSDDSAQRCPNRVARLVRE